MEENPTAIDDSQKPPKARNAKEKKKWLKTQTKQDLETLPMPPKFLCLNAGNCWTGLYFTRWGIVKYRHFRHDWEGGLEKRHGKLRKCFRWN